MAEFDTFVGAITRKLKDMGVGENTITIVTTDNGAQVMSWPDGAMTPFRGARVLEPWINNTWCPGESEIAEVLQQGTL